MLKLLFCMALLVSSLSAVAADEETRAAGKNEQSPERGEMNRLVKESLGLAVKSLSSEESGLYPYAMTMNQDGKMNLNGYQGERSEAPEPDQWFSHLVQSLRKSTNSDESIKAVVVTRLHRIAAEDGEKVPGIWMLVDHRNNQPWMVFFPLVKNDSGKREVGDPAYQATNKWIFSKPTPKQK